MISNDKKDVYDEFLKIIERLEKGTMGRELLHIIAFYGKDAISWLENVEDIGTQGEKKILEKKVRKIKEKVDGVVEYYSHEAIVSEKFVVIRYDHRFLAELLVAERARKIFKKPVIVVSQRGLFSTDESLLEALGCHGKEMFGIYFCNKRKNSEEVFKILCQRFCNL